MACRHPVPARAYKARTPAPASSSARLTERCRIETARRRNALLRRAPSESYMSLRKSLPALLAAFLLVPGAAMAASDSPLAWETLASVKETNSNGGASVEFTPSLMSLDQKVVAIKGFRVPLEK